MLHFHIFEGGTVFRSYDQEVKNWSAVKIQSLPQKVYVTFDMENVTFAQKM